MRVTKAAASVGVRFRMRPAPAVLPGLRELTLELLRVGEDNRDVAPAGKDAVKRGRQLPQQNQAQWKLKLPADMEEGAYVFRIRAYDEDNLLLREAVSDPFIVGDVEEEEPTAQDVPTLHAARVAAQAVAGNDVNVGWPPQLSTMEGSGRITVRFPNVGTAWVLHRPPGLAEIERWTLESPDTLAWRVPLQHPDQLDAVVFDIEAPDAFLEVRRQLFQVLQERQLPVESKASVSPCVALADLSGLDDLVERYAQTWANHLNDARSTAEAKALLSIDQVVITDAPKGAEATLLGPTHPLRLLWQLRYRETLERWLSLTGADGAELTELTRLLPSLLPANVPDVIPAAFGALRHVEPLDAGWGLWAATTHADAGGLVAFVRQTLGFDRAGVSGFRTEEVVRRIRRYLVAHPYVNVLTLNFVQPGTARLVLEALLTLQADVPTQDLHYVVRLFSRGLARWEVGSALDEFMADPEGSRIYKREAVDAFTAATEDPLAPKLTYSKHELDELLHTPDRFPAHLTFFLDWFDLRHRADSSSDCSAVTVRERACSRAGCVFPTGR